MFTLTSLLAFVVSTFFGIEMPQTLEPWEAPVPEVHQSQNNSALGGWIDIPATEVQTLEPWEAPVPEVIASHLRRR